MDLIIEDDINDVPVCFRMPRTVADTRLPPIKIMSLSSYHAGEEREGEDGCALQLEALFPWQQAVSKSTVGDGNHTRKTMLLPGITQGQQSVSRPSRIASPNHFPTIQVNRKKQKTNIEQV